MVFKKIIIVLICLVGLSSCIWIWPFDYLYGERLEEEPDSQPSSYVEWYLKNATMKTIVLNIHFEEFYKPMILPQESDTLIDYSWLSNTDDVFDALWNGEKDSVVIKLNGEVVRVWRRSEKNNSGKQFFDRSYWEKSMGTREGSPCTIWTFKVTPEDIK